MSAYRVKPVDWQWVRLNCWEARTIAGKVTLERVLGRWVVSSGVKRFNRVNRSPEGRYIDSLEEGQRRVQAALEEWVAEHLEAVQ